MDYIYSINPTLGAAIMLAIMLCVLIALEIYNGRRMGKLAYPAYEYALKRSQQDADRIIQEARSQARDLLQKAEAQSLDLAGSHKSQDEAAEREYQQTLKTMLESFQKRLEESAHAAYESAERAGAALSSQIESQNTELKTRLAGAYESIEKQAASRIDEQVKQAFAVAQHEAEEYERARKNAIDSRALALVSETLKIALQRSFPSDVHAELVRAALEEAKAKHIF